MPEIREYERTSTTFANVYVQARVDRYLRDLEQRLRALGFGGQLFVMLSSGGIGTIETATRFPIRLLESGPAAGALAAAYFGADDRRGRPDLVRHGRHDRQAVRGRGRPAADGQRLRGRPLYRFKRGSGLPVKMPVIEMIEIGAGGGSIARIDALGLLKVGPDSAGAEPGPACYGRGGTEPTVTDADLLLGYLDPAFFLGGRMPLDLAAAERAMARIADPLGHERRRGGLGHPPGRQREHGERRPGPRDRARQGPALVPAVRLRRGRTGPRLPGRRDPARAAMISPFGGRRDLDGRLPGGAAGLRLRADLVRAAGRPGLGARQPRSSTRWRAAGARSCSASGVPTTQISVRRTADLRYVGQGYEVRVPVPHGPLGRELADDAGRGVRASLPAALRPDRPDVASRS